MVISAHRFIATHPSFLDSDFIDVPTIAKSSEPILLPSDDESADIVETSNNNTTHNTSSEFIELDHDENSHNSTAIEDIKAIIDNDQEQPSTSDVEPKQSTVPQIVKDSTLA